LNLKGRVEIRNQIVRFEDEEPTAYKEAMMGPDFVEWLDAIEIRDNIHVRKSSSELDRPSRGVKPHKRKWIYKQTWITTSLEKLDLSKIGLRQDSRG
jgi:hypothetical protein